MRGDSRVERQVAWVGVGAQRLTLRVEHIALGVEQLETCPQRFERGGALRVARGDGGRCGRQARLRQIDCLHAPERIVLGRRQFHAHRVELPLHLHELGRVANSAPVQLAIELANTRLQRGSLQFGEFRA